MTAGEGLNNNPGQTSAAAGVDCGKDAMAVANQASRLG